MNQVLDFVKYTDKNLVESILNNYFILDYGYISKVNDDGTVDVTHAKKMVMRDGTVLDGTVTTGLQLLTFSIAGFSFKLDYKQGDKVLLLGLKDMVEDVAEVSAPETPKGYLHYERSTMKAVPLCVFNSDAKVQIETSDGTLKVTTDQKIELNGNDKQFVTWSELNQALQQLWTSIQTHTHPATSGTTSASVELATVTLDISSAKTTTVVTGG